MCTATVMYLGRKLDFSSEPNPFRRMLNHLSLIPTGSLNPRHMSAALNLPASDLNPSYCTLQKIITIAYSPPTVIPPGIYLESE